MFSLLPEHFLKQFEGEMLIIAQPTTPLQMFCKYQINSKVIFKSTIIPEDNISGGSRGMNGSTVKYFLINTEYEFKRYNIIRKLITLIL